MWTMHKAAILPSPVRIAGVWLRPPTVAQWLLLEIVESPYIVGGCPTPGDMALCVALCWLPARAGRWGLRHTWALKAVAVMLGWLSRKASWRVDSETLSDWLTKCAWKPDRIKTEGTGPSWPMSAPYAVRLAWMLAERMPMRRVWSMSIAEAQLWSIAANEEEGGQYDTAIEYAQAGIPEEAAYLSDDLKREWKKAHGAQSQAEPEGQET